jgi:hypothetical protein
VTVSPSTAPRIVQPARRLTVFLGRCPLQSRRPRRTSQTRSSQGRSAGRSCRCRRTRRDSTLRSASPPAGHRGSRSAARVGPAARAPRIAPGLSSRSPSARASRSRSLIARRPSVRSISSSEHSLSKPSAVTNRSSAAVVVLTAASSPPGTGGRSISLIVASARQCHHRERAPSGAAVGRSGRWRSGRQPTSGARASR